MRIGPVMSLAASGLALFCFAGAAHADPYSKAVQNALVQAGEVSQAEVNRRKAASR